MSHYLQVVKTPKSIEEITDLVSDRLIITKSGQLYFDYSSDLRIEISNSSKPYLCHYNFSTKSLNDILTLKLSDIFELDAEGDERPVISIKNNSLIFDENGNYALIFKVASNHQQCECKIIGLINQNVKDTIIDKLGNEIIGSFIVAKYIYGVEISFSKLNITTGEITSENIILKSDDSLNITQNEDNPNQIDFGIKVSKFTDNLLQVVSDGLLVINPNNDEFNKLYKFSNPYNSLDDISMPYDENVIYLIGTEAPYKTYVAIDSDLVYLGDSGISDEFKEEFMNELLLLINKNQSVTRIDLDDE